MTRQFNLAIVGTGGIAEIHARDLGRLSDRARIVATVDPDDARLAAFSERWSVPHRFPSIDKMLDGLPGAELPDVVVLCTPPGLHAHQAIAAMDHGLTVLCEKPPALSLSEIDRIAAAEESGSGHFAGVVQHRFGSGAQTLRALVRDGALGLPMNAVCNTLWFRPDEYFMVPWRGNWDIEGGGPTMGHGIHQMDLVLSILGPWRTVVAVADRRARPTDTEDVSAAIVTFESGAIATMVNSLVSPRETSYLRFDFAKATVELEHLYGYSDDNWAVTAAPDLAAEVDKAWASGPKGVPSGHGAQYAALLEALESGTPPPVTINDIRPTMDLVTSIYASAFTGRLVHAGEIGPDSPFYERMDGGKVPWPPTTIGADR